MKSIKYGLIVSGMMVGSLPAQADMELGKKLVEQNCISCHDNSVFTRPKRQVRSLSALKQRVDNCEKPAGVNWSAKQTDAVVDYLNKSFYHFK